MMDANPQIRHVLNDPSVLRQTMEMMRNPNAMQQVHMMTTLLMMDTLAHAHNVICMNAHTPMIVSPSDCNIKTTNY